MEFLKKLLPADLGDRATSKTFSNILAYAVGLFGAALLAPVIWAAVSGLVGLVAGAVVLWCSIKFAPWFGLWTSNLFLKLIKFEAMKNPVETLQQVEQSYQKQISEDEALASEFSKDIERHKPIVRDMVRNYPEDAAPFVQHLSAMEETKELVYQAITAAKADLQEFRKQIKRADAIWQATQSSNSLSKFAGRLTKSDAIKQIQTDAALQAVRDRMTGSFANLDHLRRMMKDKAALQPVKPEVSPSGPTQNVTKILTNQDVQVLDVSVSTMKVNQPR